MTKINTFDYIINSQSDWNFLKNMRRLLHGSDKVTWPSFTHAGGLLFITHCPFNKIKIFMPGDDRPWKELSNDV